MYYYDVNIDSFQNTGCNFDTFRAEIRQRVGRRCWHVVKRCQNSFLCRFQGTSKGFSGVYGGQCSLRGLFPGQKPAGTRQPLRRSSRNEIRVSKRELITRKLTTCVKNV